MVLKVCGICDKNIRGNAKSVCCNYCNKWIHLKCNSISNNKYNELQDNKSFFCIRCFNNELPFGFESDESFSRTVTLGLENSNIENLNINISKKRKK